MRITGLPTGSVTSDDQIAIDNTTNGTRKVNLSTYLASNRPIHKTESVTSLPKTITDANITASHRVVDMKITGATTSYVLSWTTSAGSVVFSLSSGTFSSSTFDFNLEITQ